MASYNAQIDEYRENREARQQRPSNNVSVINVELENRDLALARQL